MDLDDLLDLQHGVISRAQAHACGPTDRRIEWLVESGRWLRVRLGVYATITGPSPFLAQVWAAILRAGRGAVASHRTAAFPDGLCDEPGPVIHVTVPTDRYVEPRIDDVRVHFAHRLLLTRHPSATPPRTRLDETVLDLVDVAKRHRRRPRHPSLRPADVFGQPCTVAARHAP